MNYINLYSWRAQGRAFTRLKNYRADSNSRSQPNNSILRNFIFREPQVVISSMPEDDFGIKPCSVTVPYTKDNHLMNELESKLIETNNIEKILSDGHILHWVLKGNFNKI